ncbi:hypothetical protein UlMin_013729 [Ulmus minor]
MGDSTCVMQMQPFSYVSGIAHEAKEGNPIHALGQSISFGRFVSESLAWEKWSTFSHNRYVEEAERFSQPGSVAQKKAFFEAHYKKLAARKAAALLEQANAEAGNDAKTESENGFTPQESEVVVDDEKVAKEGEKGRNLDVGVNGCDSNAKRDEFEGSKVEVADEGSVDSQQLNGTAKMDKLSPKKEREVSVPISKKKTTPSSSKSSTKTTTKSTALNATPMSKKPAVDSTDKKRTTPKSHHKSVNFTPIREINRLTSTVIRKIENSRVGGASSSKATKDCPTPIRTPIMVSKNGLQQHPSTTPCSENRRATTPLHPSASGIKPAGSKWRLLPTATDCSKFLSACKNKAQSPFSSTPFSLRTEERAARRKEKLENKFNANEAKKEQLQTLIEGKPEKAVGKLRQSFCFKARPLPDFYKQRQAPKDEMKKVPVSPQSPKLGSKHTPSKVEGKSTSVPPYKSAVKNSASKHVPGKDGRSRASLFPRSTTKTRENTSPNIQQGLLKLNFS